MGKSTEKRKLVFETRVPLDEALDYLKDLHAALSAGSVYLRKENVVMAFHPTAMVTLEVEGEEKGKKQSIEISLEWERDTEAGPDEIAPFAITTEAPLVVSGADDEVAEDDDDEEYEDEDEDDEEPDG